MFPNVNLREFTCGCRFSGLSEVDLCQISSYFFPSLTSDVVVGKSKIQRECVFKREECES